LIFVSLKTIAKKITPGPFVKVYHKFRYGNSTLLNSEKLRLIDFAMRQGARTFADLGGMWRVNGGYSVYCADKGAKRATLVDFHATPEFIAEQSKRVNLEFLQRNFALPETAREVDEVDCVMLFDVLLHQVKPDWDEVIKVYAPFAKQFLIYNQQFTGAHTVRLLDQGREWYLRHVPHSPENASEYLDLFDKAEQLHPRYSDGRTYRDMHDVWQWGITDHDLKRAMDELGFHATYERDCGAWPGIEEIRNKAFVFKRTSN
jgi:hypothetical protein